MASPFASSETTDNCADLRSGRPPGPSTAKRRSSSHAPGIALIRWPLCGPGRSNDAVTVVTEAIGAAVVVGVVVVVVVGVVVVVVVVDDAGIGIGVAGTTTSTLAAEVAVEAWKSEP